MEVLKKIKDLENPTTMAIEKFKPLIDRNLITAKKLLCGPLAVFSGEYRLELTEKGRALVNEC